MNYISVECISGRSYKGFELSNQLSIPKTSRFYSCGVCSNEGGEFSVYVTNKKTYIIFKKNRKNIW